MAKLAVDCAPQEEMSAEDFMADEKQSDSPKNSNPAESGVKELSESELKDVSGGVTIAKLVDKSSPKLYEAVANGTKPPSQ